MVHQPSSSSSPFACAAKQWNGMLASRRIQRNGWPIAYTSGQANYASVSRKTTYNVERRRIGSNSPLPERTHFHSDSTLPESETSTMNQGLKIRTRSSTAYGEDWTQSLWIPYDHTTRATTWLISVRLCTSKNIQPGKCGEASAKWWPERTALGALSPQSHLLISAIWENHYRDRLHLARPQNGPLCQAAI